MRCTWCGRLGVSYEYRGQRFDGLTAYRGDHLCPACRDQRLHDEGITIRLVNRSSGDTATFNTAEHRRSGRWLFPGSRFRS